MELININGICQPTYQTYKRTARSGLVFNKILHIFTSKNPYWIYNKI